MFVVVLIVFECMLIDKQVWGSNLGQRGSKIRFLKENKMGSREETKKTGLCSLVQLAWRAGASHGELLREVTHVLGVPGNW